MSRPAKRSGRPRDLRPPPGCPMHAGAPEKLARTDLTYNDYLKITDMLALQVPQSNPPHHDEMLFIVIHQAYELWFKLVLHEMGTVMEYMNQGDPLSAHHFMKRIVEIMRLMVGQIHILETMSPIDFLDFRDRLTPASGFQSTQFREIEFLAGLKDERYLKYFKHRPEFVELLTRRMEARDLRTCYYEMMRKLGYELPLNAARLENDFERRSARKPVRGTAGGARSLPAGVQRIIDAIRPIYQKPSHHLPAYLLTEALVDFDQQLGIWREHHVRVVERVIGFRRGSGGSSGVQYLKSTTTKKCFPLLWELRTHLEKSV